MVVLGRFAFAMVMLCCGVQRAEASCAIALGGDAAAIERVRSELDGFADDGSSCLPLWVQCQSIGDQIEIDLHDGVGRSSLRLFASPGGAAAFIISWSRRPLLAAPAASDRLAPPSATPPRAVAADRSIFPDLGWQPALGAGYVASTGDLHSWGTITGSLTWDWGILRVGPAVRGIIGGVSGSDSAEAQVMLGVDRRVSRRFTEFYELTIGRTIVGESTNFRDLGYGTMGVRGTLRTALRWRLPASLELEAALGYDLVRRVDGSSTLSLSADPSLFAGFVHLDLGMRWVP